MALDFAASGRGARGSAAQEPPDIEDMMPNVLEKVSGRPHIDTPEKNAAPVRTPSVPGLAASTDSYLLQLPT